MALKDWKKVEDNYINSEYRHKKTLQRIVIYVLTNDVDIESVGRKEFKSHSQAFRYAKNYMKKN